MAYTKGKVEVHVKMNHSKIRKYADEISREMADNAARNVQIRARKNIMKGRRNWTGQMRDGILLTKGTGNKAYRGRIVAATAPYSHFQEYGTRAHGPRRAKFLRFRVRGKGPYIFTKWVRGVTPLYFMRDAYKSLTVKDFVGRSKR